MAEATTQPDARTRNILSASALPVLLRMATPNAMAFVVQASVSMTEVWYVGQLGTSSLAAMALVFPGLMLMQMLANGSIGGSVTGAVAQAIGRGHIETAERLIWHAIAIAVAAGLVFMCFYLLFGRSLLSVFGASTQVLEQANSYATILFCGCITIWLMALLSSIFRSMGNMLLPATLMVAAACIQIPLSGTLILGWFGVPSMGITGAAVSVITTSFLMTLVLLYKLHHAPVRLHLNRLKLSHDLFRSIYSVGLLASLSPFLVVFSVTSINFLVSGFGEAILAGYGIGSRVEFLIIPLVFGVGVSMTSMVGINIGAGNIKRAESISWLGGGVAALVSGVVGIVLSIFPWLWVDLFTSDPVTVQAASLYLRIAGPTFAFLGLGLSLYFASQGAGKVLWPIIATFCRVLVAVFVSALGVYVFDLGLNFIYACTAGGMIIYGTVTVVGLKFSTWHALHRMR